MNRRLKRLNCELGLELTPPPFELDAKQVCRQVHDILVTEQRERKLYMKQKIKFAAVLVAAVVALTGTALAVGPTVWEALQDALGPFAPYAQSVDDAVCVENGVEIKVLSAMADGSMVKVYATARDLEGDRLSADMFVFGRVAREQPERGEGSVSGGGGKVVSYDPDTKTALLEFSSSGTIPSDLTGMSVSILQVYSNGMGKGGIRGENDARWNVPITIEKMSERVIALTDTLWKVELRKLVISPLGMTLHTGGDGNIASCPMAVKMTDGTFQHLKFGGQGGDGLTEDEELRTCWEFDDSADADKVAGIAFGYWFIPIEGDTALPGYWLSEIPE